MLDVDLVRWRRALHEIPEPGFAEVETSAYLRGVLRRMGLDVEPRAGTGLMAEIAGRGRGARVALRADMDGLPLQEETGEAFSSRHAGMMHACGHDIHMAILLGAARNLLARRDFPGRIRLLFQPSGEKLPGGARALIAEGVLQGVDGVIGLHVRARDPVGVVGMRAGAVMANADSFEISVDGRGGHESEPEPARDAVLIGSQIVVNLQQIVSRRIAPLSPVVVSVGSFQAGSAPNIMAESARLSGTVRTFSARLQDLVAQEITKTAAATAAMHGAVAEVAYHRGVPAVINDAPVLAAWRQALDGVVRVMDTRPSMAGEDFAYYLNEVPGAFIFLGGRPDGGVHPHHSPHFRVSEACLPFGVEVMTRGARALLEHPDVLRRARWREGPV
ncbi:MAG: M20 metallopeptidase family protein [Clostridia bacterium]